MESNSPATKKGYKHFVKESSPTRNLQSLFDIKDI